MRVACRIHPRAICPSRARHPPGARSVRASLVPCPGDAVRLRPCVAVGEARTRHACGRAPSRRAPVRAAFGPHVTPRAIGSDAGRLGPAGSAGSDGGGGRGRNGSGCGLGADSGGAPDCARTSLARCDGPLSGGDPPRGLARRGTGGDGHANGLARGRTAGCRAAAGRSARHRAAGRAAGTSRGHPCHAPPARPKVGPRGTGPPALPVGLRDVSCLARRDARAAGAQVVGSVQPTGGELTGWRPARMCRRIHHPAPTTRITPMTKSKRCIQWRSGSRFSPSRTPTHRNR